ncbi:hypothetical protein J1N35_007225 [Gossypium stocksii]|uniref:Uncharacterized protein n=1 Tax=Gossypium stocksii TaxID=47602 RepID=A0A9D4ADA2_9ROSI|nr:hypothetical protein J1N35_007225 [Gossypium stocksii]
MKFLPIRESFFSLDTTACLEYMLWFKVAAKPYLLSVEAMSRQFRQKRSRKSPQQRRFGRGDAIGSFSDPTQQAPPMSTLNLGQFTLFICNPVFFSQAPHYSPPVAPCIYTYRKYVFWGTFAPNILPLYVDVDADTCTYTDSDTKAVINANIEAHITADISGCCNDIWLFVDSVTNTHRAIVLSRWVIGTTIFLWSGGHMMGG